MNSRIVLLTAFVLVALVQLYVPAKMIWDREDVLRTGTEYKFRTAPIDPTDPFRGKYITLSYDENSIEISDAENWVSGESIYVALGTDKEGFARIESVSRARPTDGADFIEAQVWYVSESDPRRLMIDYPFDRYYMEESKAQEAEDTHRRAQRDTTRITYALVSVKNGDAVVKDVLIDGISISEIVKANREGAKE
jgi:uncharacterized membrane-anchored protein